MVTTSGDKLQGTCLKLLRRGAPLIPTYSTTSVIRTSIIQNLDYPNLKLNQMLKLFHLIKTWMLELGYVFIIAAI